MSVSDFEKIKSPRASTEYTVENYLQLISNGGIMKKKSLFIISTILILTSCMGKEKMHFNTRDKMNAQAADEIIKCINKKDISSLYDLFSVKVKTEDLNLKDDIKKTI